MTLALLNAGVIDEFVVPIEVKLLAATAISLGTAAGGWRIIKTMGTGWSSWTRCTASRRRRRRPPSSSAPRARHAGEHHPHHLQRDHGYRRIGPIQCHPLGCRAEHQLRGSSRFQPPGSPQPRVPAAESNPRRSWAAHVLAALRRIGRRVVGTSPVGRPGAPAPRPMPCEPLAAQVDIILSRQTGNDARDHVALAGQHDAGVQIAHGADHALLPPPRRRSGPRSRARPPPASPAKRPRLNGLPSGRVGRANIGRIEVRQQPDQLVSLRPPAGAAQSVVIRHALRLTALPLRTRSTILPIAEPRTKRSSTSRSVPGQGVVRLPQGEPLQLVHFAGGTEAARSRLHRPPAHELLACDPESTFRYLVSPSDRPRRTW